MIKTSFRAGLSRSSLQAHFGVRVAFLISPVDNAGSRVSSAFLTQSAQRFRLQTLKDWFLCCCALLPCRLVDIKDINVIVITGRFEATSVVLRSLFLACSQQIAIVDRWSAEAVMSNRCSRN